MAEKIFLSYKERVFQRAHVQTCDNIEGGVKEDKEFV